jgi:alanine-synthesizing transaminase
MRALYKERRDVLVDGLNASGWTCPSPPATMFVWAPIPPQFKDMGVLNFTKMLLQEADVAVAPGVGFGEEGEGFVRLGLVENTHRIRQALRNIRGFLASHGVTEGLAKSA